jgi:stearoyl-CoA desaturase (delta-9 desaturase)
VYIRALQALGLAEVKKVAPRLKLEAGKAHCDLATLQAVVTHRYEVLAKYAKSVRTTCAIEMRALRASAVSVDWRAMKRWLHNDTSALPQKEREERERVLRASSKLATVYTMRDELAALWQRSTASKEQLVHQLEDWCKRAEASGIEALQNFSRRLRCYA